MNFRKNKRDFSKLLIIFLIILINSLKASIISTPSEIRSIYERCFVKNKPFKCPSCRGEVDNNQNIENYRKFDLETLKKEKVHLECSSLSDYDPDFVNNVELVIPIQLNSDIINAVKSNNIELVQELIDINVLRENDGWSLLHIASHEGHSDIVELLIEMNVPVNLLQKNGWTPLLLALKSGKSEIQKILIANGASLNFVDQAGRTSLHYAVKTGHLELEIVKLLIKNRADVNVSDNEGCTPLNFASKAVHFGIVKILIKIGADVNSFDNNSCTPINSAAKKGHLEIVKLLFENHADINITDNEGWAPLKSAASRNCQIFIRQYQILILYVRT